MDISYLGHASFKIKGKHASVLIDPFDPEMVGFPFPKHTSADIVCITHEHKDHNNKSLVEGSPFIISGPGEYEMKGVQIIGIPSFHDSEEGKARGRMTLYHITIDEVNIVHLGDLGTMLTKDDIEKLDGVDILMVPVGGVFTITPEEAAKIVAELEPAIVIPMHYKTEKHSKTSFGSFLPVSAFLKAIGSENITPIPKLSVGKDRLPTEMQIVVLE